jgi:phage terminase large subunit-like protein
MASRPEGFVMYSSTQSDEPPAGVFKQKLQYARDVRDGKVVDPAFLPVLYEFPRAMVESGAAREPKNFYVTNPNLGASVDEEFLRRGLAQAENDGEQALRDFLAKHLNVEIGLNLRSDRWAGADFWEDAAEPGLTLDSLLERSEVAVVGIDGGGLDDLLGLAVIGRDRETRKWLLWAHAWAHKIALERRKDIAPRLLDFEKDGDLTMVDVPGDDVAEVARIVCKVRDSGLLPEKNGIGVDAAGIGDVVDALTAPGCDIAMECIVGVSQGWRLNSAVKTAERKIAAREMVHGGTNLMAWVVGNAKVEAKGNAVMITKQQAGSAKIDPLMAAFDAVSLMSLAPQATMMEADYRLLAV